VKSHFFVVLLAVVALAAPLAHADSQAPSSIIANVKRSKVAGIDLIVDHTAVKDVVIITGSLPAGAVFDPPGKPATATLVAGMLDKGTTRNDKFALAHKLEDVGASISFTADNYVTEFQATCLKQDLPLVLALLAEQLRTPAFSAEEFEKLKPQVIGTLQQALDNPRARAAETFSQIAYPQGHPNRKPTLQEQIDAVKAARLDDVKAFHAAHFGPSHMTMVVAGDVEWNQVRAQTEKSFSGWRGGSALPEAPRPDTASSANMSDKDKVVFMPGKTSVIMLMGQADGLKHRDPDALALRVATTILGSGFTGRLMKNVRDKEGLTYGIGAVLDNDTFADGEWKINATFAPALLEKGVDSTRRQLAEWYQKGVTAAELEQRKTQLVGTYYVSLATTRGIASELLETVQRGYDLSWLDEYPKALQALTLDQVNGAIKKYLDPDKMILIQAGTVEPAKS
jgi:zinc protease